MTKKVLQGFHWEAGLSHERGSFSGVMNLGTNDILFVNAEYFS